MKLNHLIAALALGLLPVTTSTALAISAADPLPPIVTGENDVAGDFNEDGRPDLLWQNSDTHELGVWLMSGLKPTAAALVQSATEAHGLIAVGTDDFNGDDRTDAVLWDPATGRIVFWFLDGLVAVGMEDVTVGFPGHRPVSILDHNRDGNPDILFQDYKGAGEITSSSSTART